MEKEQAAIIIEQLGGNRFLAMTGAKNFMVGDTLNFSIPRSNNIKKVTIALNWKDLYDVRFWKVGRGDFKQIAEDLDIYAEDLRGIFTSRTGLSCTL